MNPSIAATRATAIGLGACVLSLLLVILLPDMLGKSISSSIITGIGWIIVSIGMYPRLKIERMKQGKAVERKILMWYMAGSVAAAVVIGLISVI